jgi:hypothetical protein
VRGEVKHVIVKDEEREKKEAYKISKIVREHEEKKHNHVNHHNGMSEHSHHGFSNRSVAAHNVIEQLATLRRHIPPQKTPRKAYSNQITPHDLR